MPITDNILLSTDVYKMGHMQQYKPGTTKVYSYLTARSGKNIDKIVWFGNQYYLKEYLSRPIYKYHVDEFMDLRKGLLGNFANDVYEKLMNLQALGYWPIKIKALPEGTVVNPQVALATYTNTHPDFYWVVGFLESLLLKVWYPSTVASYSRKLHELVTKYGHLTCDNLDHIPFSVHDFGYRGVSSEESAAIGGAAHLVNFLGTDTVPAIKFLQKYYNASGTIGLSVPASEHSVMCSFGPEHEFDAFVHMLDTYPDGIVSIVADTYNLWRVLTEFMPKLKDRILARNGKVVLRPDSGVQRDIICGNDQANTEVERYGAIKHLMKTFGYTVNNKGYRVLNPKVGLIYGDGFYWDRYVSVLEEMYLQNLATSNLVVGIGGLLLQNHSRDTQGYALKATYSEIKGVPQELYKDPITDPGKKSYKGLLRTEMDNGELVTFDQQTEEQEQFGDLQTVFSNGVLTKEFSLYEVRSRVNSTL